MISVVDTKLFNVLPGNKMVTFAGISFAKQESFATPLDKSICNLWVYKLTFNFIESQS